MWREGHFQVLVCVYVNNESFWVPRTGDSSVGGFSHFLPGPGFVSAFLQSLLSGSSYSAPFLPSLRIPSQGPVLSRLLPRGGVLGCITQHIGLGNNMQWGSSDPFVLNVRGHPSPLREPRWPCFSQAPAAIRWRACDAQPPPFLDPLTALHSPVRKQLPHSCYFLKQKH